MAAPVFQKRKFAEIKHLLPDDAWAVQRNNHKGEFEEEMVSLHEGDLVVDLLNLDFTENDDLFQLIILGNLTAGNILNDETDGAVGLTVLGDLTAGNIAVGGQEIYVTGNLTVHDLFWGDYNHGELKVNGHISAKAFLATEEYHFDWKRVFDKDRTDIRYPIVDDAYHDYPRSVVSDIFEEACVLKEEDIGAEIYGFKYWLDTAEISRRLSAIIPILQKEGRKTQEPAIPGVFTTEFLTDENMDRLRTSMLIQDQLEFWRGDRFTRVTVKKDQPNSTAVYFQHKADYAVMVYYLVHEGKLYRAAAYSRVSGEDRQWHFLNVETVGEEYKTLLEEGWKALLTEYSAMEYYQQMFRERITTEKVTAILSLPLVKEKYSDYNNEDADDLRVGMLMCTFRQPGGEKCGRITIIRSFPHREGDDRYLFYHFDLRAGEVILRSQDRDGYDSKTYDVPVTEAQRFKEAVEYFEVLARTVVIRN